ncbi:MAG: NAD+ synthase [Chloroflexota bacterium]|nr:NAD+ synthase [Chloroflexota bacterium]
MSKFRIALAQVNVTVGDLAGNKSKIIEYMVNARDVGADVVVFPELSVTGYPPEDLVLRPQFVDDNILSLNEIAGESKGISAVIGFVDRDSALRNSAAVVFDGAIRSIYHKTRLPNYGVFDEKRYFEPGRESPVYLMSGIPVGVNICEDIWDTGIQSELRSPFTTQALSGAKVIFTLNGSPYYAGKLKEREQLVGNLAKHSGVYCAYVNLVGGQDELVFDGASMVVSPEGKMIAQARQFEEDLLVTDIELDKTDDRSNKIFISSNTLSYVKPDSVQHPVDKLDETGEIFQALVLGTRDYVRKCGFSKVLIALSGGIDSSLVAAIAVEALGPQNVVVVFMTSKFSSKQSEVDAIELSRNLQIEYKTISIEEPFSVMIDKLSSYFKGTDWGVAEENLQSRLRGNLIMALSNKFDWLVLTTGNKSEMATGYATIYGDMAGGFAVLKDVPKILVYKLAKHINKLANKCVIPDSVLTKAPSAELRFEQKDQDSLPPYETLDPILKAYVEDDLSYEEIVSHGFAEDIVKQTINLVNKSEYKRKQAPPGIKITPRNFGRDRRMPIANRYKSF